MVACADKLNTRFQSLFQTVFHVSCVIHNEHEEDQKQSKQLLTCAHDASHLCLVLCSQHTPIHGQVCKFLDLKWHRLNCCPANSQLVKAKRSPAPTATLLRKDFISRLAISSRVISKIKRDQNQNNTGSAFFNRKQESIQVKK